MVRKINNLEKIKIKIIKNYGIYLKMRWGQKVI
jgi:hypothetical protein